MVPITLTEQHKNKDKQSLIQELQAHVKNTTAPYKYPRKVSLSAMIVLLSIDTENFLCFVHTSQAD